MKKKIAALFCTLAVLCVCLCGTAFAAKKPSVEVISLQIVLKNGGVCEPTIYYRNNSNKDIKYVDWYVTAYNRVGDPIPGIATKKLTSIGPDQPFRLVRENEKDLKVKRGVSDSCPFKYYKETGYYVAIGNYEELKQVCQDIYGNFFVQTDTYDVNSCTYLTENEIQSAMSDRWCKFNDVGWYSNVISYILVDRAVITYIDGSSETINCPYSDYCGMTPQNLPFAQQLAQYQDVYNYQDYLRLNLDLAAAFSTNQKALFEHFISSGMKEGRQGSIGFNLEAYKANNPDLVAAFGNDNVKYYEHYISTGKAEGRIAA